jgi:pimeloyl-ACP methyl ester carboxylesterase
VPAEREASVGGIRTRYWEAGGERPGHPVVFVHGNPTSADDWLPFLERLEGRRRCLAPDLVGWGKSERRSGCCTMDRLAWFVERFLDELAPERFDIVVHDWGAIALAPASRRPERVGRMAILNAVPLSSAYRWHWVARMWRRRGVGELVLATMTRFGTAQLLRQATTTTRARLEAADAIHRYLDRGTKRAILELYRDADPERVEVYGRELHRLTGPALVVWGDADPYIGPDWADNYAERLGGEARVEHLPDAGHWPWQDRPDAIDLVTDFLST